MVSRYIVGLSGNNGIFGFVPVLPMTVKLLLDWEGRVLAVTLKKPVDKLARADQCEIDDHPGS